MEKELEEQEGDIWIKIFSSTPSFKRYQDYLLFYYEPRFNGVFTGDILPRTKDGAYIINLDVKNSKGTRWVSLFISRNTAVYFDSFRIKHNPLEVLNKMRDKSLTQNIFRIQENESILCDFTISLSYNICLLEKLC